MNAAKVAAALNTISVAFGELAEALIEQPGSPRPVESVAARSAPAPADLPLEELIPDEGSLAVCPKHHKPFSPGNYGPYCKSTTDDPAWANKKGYCTITPKNAAVYLRTQAAA
jgi:hypothetical protein